MFHSILLFFFSLSRIYILVLLFQQQFFPFHIFLTFTPNDPTSKDNFYFVSKWNFSPSFTSINSKSNKKIHFDLL